MNRLLLVSVLLIVVLLAGVACSSTPTATVPPPTATATTAPKATATTSPTPTQTIATVAPSTPTMAPTPTPAPPAAKPEGTLTIASHSLMAAAEWDPSQYNGLSNPFAYYYALHDALVKPMPGNQFAPSLAESWTISPDGLVYEFKLRKGVKFHSGDEVTSADVKFTYDRYKGLYADVIKKKVSSVETPDPYTARFRLANPWPDFMTNYAWLATPIGWILPSKYIQQVGDEGFRKKPIGAGPYKFVNYDASKGLVLEANESYWRKMPNIKTIVIKEATDGATRFAMLKTGEADVAYVISGALATQLTKEPNLRVEVPDSPAAFWLDFPQKSDPKSPFNDVRVRQAVGYALDMKAINDKLYLGFGKLIGSIIYPRFEFAVPYDQIPYDPQKARQLLKDAGYANGFDAGDFTPFPPYTDFAQAIALYLQDVGIRVNIKTMERPAFMDAYRNKQLKGVILAVTGAYGNAATIMESYVISSAPYAQVGYPEIDKLFAQQAVEVNYEKRKAILAQIQQILHDQAIFVPVINIAVPYGIGPRVKGQVIGVIPAFSYAGPYEDLQLKK